MMAQELAGLAEKFRFAKSGAVGAQSHLSLYGCTGTFWIRSFVKVDKDHYALNS